jgi:hypothetical protein
MAGGGGLNFMQTPGGSIGTDALSAFPVSSGDSMYGGFNPFDDTNINQTFEIPGGGLGGFGSSGSDTSTASAYTGALGGLGLSPGPGATSSGTSLGGDSSGTSGASSGCSWNDPLSCVNSLLKSIPGNPGVTGLTPGSSGSQCGATNIQACFTEFFGTFGDFASRAAVVVLGFIFVAAGLFMFGRTVPFVRHAVPNVLKP